MSNIYLNADAAVSEQLYKQITESAAKAITELLYEADLKTGNIFVIGCSSSEILGSKIGKGSSYNAAKAVFEAIYPILSQKGIYIAAQCCEHLNRAIVIEREAAEKYGYEPVCVIPKPKAGGSFATVAHENLDCPVVVEQIKAHAGIDIGGTLIGMHLKDVAVPVRVSISKIGEANIVCARTRPKLIGGERAIYK
ncbi:MAG: TIGR01440 family protein [Ruminococcaceae bacterium]|nr:TIGR01440 family protein [Oscillospiraceae bacterium]